MSTITAFNKIGFHAGPDGNHNGLGDYMRRLDEVGIPFVIKSVDHYGHCFEATQYSNTEHVICFRLSTLGQSSGFDYDVPDYSLDPEEAALKHWQATLKALPPEFDREKVWLEPINEVDKNRSDWLGHYAYHTGKLALRDGYKVMQFSFSSGEPELDHWETEGMLRYLRQCAEHRDQLGVGLHEYSFDVRHIWRMRPHLLGRFTQLFDACDRHGITRPKVIMTEWGWTHQRVPGPTQALQDIEEVAELYAPYPEILGAAIWYLGGGSNWAHICNRTQRLIEPVTDFTLRFKREVTPKTPQKATPTAVSSAPAPRPSMATAADRPAASNARYLADLSIPDDVDITAGTQFEKKWRVQNNGQTTWADGFTIRFVGGTEMATQPGFPVPALQPGEAGEIAIPMRAPTAEGITFSDWRLHTAQGQPFGDVMYVRYNVVAPPPSTGTNDSAYVADVTIPDDTEIEAGKQFVKTWRIRNAGSRAWGAGYELVFAGGETMHRNAAVSVPPARPGETVEVSVTLTAPEIPGSHYSDWRMRDSEGNFFGELIYVRFVVPRGDHGRIAPLSQNDPRWQKTRLGDARSDTTIGKWGCLLTTYAMIANAYGKNVTPIDLNNRMLRHRLFLNHKETPWGVLSSLFDDIVFEGRFEARNTPDLTDRIDRALRNGQPVAVQVDQTPATPYTLADQHWVLITAREDSDYRMNDPWTYPASESSMRQRYGRPEQSLRYAILSAVFYRSTKPQAPLPVSTGGVLGEEIDQPEIALIERGMNVNPDAPHSNPLADEVLKGLEWVRFVYKVAAQPDESKRNLTAVFQEYDPLIKAYNKIGVKSLLVLNQETVWGNAPWDHGNWPGYADQLAHTARQIARRYARYGDKVAYEIWNEGDLDHNAASIYVKPADYAIMLTKVCAAIRAEAPDAPLVIGGLASGPTRAIPYLQQVLANLPDNEWPVDAIGIHPYGRWGRQAPFDWGQTFGTLGQAFDAYEKAFPAMKLWITEIGVAANNEIGPEYYRDIGNYLVDVFGTINERHATQVPVVIWFAWSDWMRHAGIVRQDGSRKDFVYDAFLQVRNNRHLV